MSKLSTLFDKIVRNKPTPPEKGVGGSNSNNDVKNLKNWYEERTATMVTQRNILLALTFFLLLLITLAIIAITVMLNLRKFDPFVIQIDDTTGSAKVVTPITTDILSGNDELAKYFIKKYVTVRETYNPVDFASNARRTIRLLSSERIYRDYLGYIANKEIDPIIRYGQKNTTFLIIKSWSKLSDNKFILRFSINETAEGKRVYNKIAVVDFGYYTMQLSEADREINPIGFQVTGYRVDDDNS